jgi:glycosyltransferase involved in cell wall biosynthesis
MSTDNTIRILFIGTASPPDLWVKSSAFSAAANNFQIGLANGLLKAGVRDIEFISLLPVPAFPRGPIGVSSRRYVLCDRIKALAPGFLNLPFLKRMSILLSFTKIVLSKTKTESYDVILVYNPLVSYLAPVLWAGKLRGIPVVLILADISPNNWLQRSLLQKCDGVIALSKQALMDLSKGIHGMCLEGGIEVSRWEDVHQSDEIVEDQCLIVYTGSLNRYGGIDLLLDAFKLLKGNYRLVISGRGEWEGKVRAAVAQDDRIAYVGFLSDNEYRALLRRATVLINPRPSNIPENEYNFPSKLLEYLASGRPVISTATAHVAEEYGDKVFLLREETPQALARLIEQVCSLSEEERKIIGQRGREYVINFKNWDIQGQRVYQFLIKIVEKSQRSSYLND